MRLRLALACTLTLIGCGGSDASVGDAGGDGSNPQNDSGGGGNDATANDSGGGNDSGMMMDSSSSDGSTTTDSGGGMDSGMKFGGRLFISMSGNAPGVWDNANSISSDVSPTFTMSDSTVTGGTRGVAIAGKRIFFGVENNNNTLVAFDNPDNLAGNAATTAKIPNSQFISIPSGNPQPQMIQFDAKTDSLWTSNQTGTELFAGASTINNNSKAKAAFTHQFQQLPGVAYDPGGDRLFLGQISGAGLLGWNGATGATNLPAFSYTLDKTTAAWSIAVDAQKDRLYAIGPYSNGGQKEAIEVWKGISGVNATKAPDFVMSSGSGIGQQDFSPWITVQNDTLIACIQAGKVLLWTNASSLSGDKAPTQTINIGSLNNSPKKAVLGPVTGRLYVLDSTGVNIYDTPTTAPKLITKITMGVTKPYDFAILE